MHKNKAFVYFRIVDEPIYRILSILSVFILFLWMIITLLHGHHYQVFDPNWGLLLPPLICLFVLGGFSENLEFDRKGNCFYYAKRFYIRKPVVVVNEVLVKADKKYGKLQVNSNGKVTDTTMIYKLERALEIAERKEEWVKISPNVVSIGVNAESER